LRITPLDEDIESGRKYLNERSLQIGHVLPLDENLFKEYFPTGNSFLLHRGRTVDALFSFNSGREKRAPIASFSLATDSIPGLKESIGRIEDAAVAQEKLVVRTRVFGYDRKRLQALKALNYKVGASLPGAVSLDGKRFDLHYLYKELDDRYRFEIRRNYAKPGLYPVIELERSKNHRLRIRGYHREDRPFLDKAATHLNVIRGIASGVFEGSIPWSPGTYEEWFDKRRVFPLVCDDESIGEPVGIIDLARPSPDVMQHVMVLGMFVRAEYQGQGAGTLLMEAVKTLCQKIEPLQTDADRFRGQHSSRETVS
jgi:GNAT superfamily N-acetyltransferase